MIKCNSTSRHTGGVIIYIMNDISYQVISIEAEKKVWFLTVRIKLEIYIDLTVIYRSPSSNPKDFFLILDNYITTKLKYENNNIIVGDININTNRMTKTAKEYYSILAQNNFKQIVNEYTRYDKKIDHFRLLIMFALIMIELHIKLIRKMKLVTIL